jgi:hypothetical protein
MPHISTSAILRATNRRYLDATETDLESLLWCVAQRSKELPDGGGPVRYGDISTRLRRAVDHGRRVGELRRDEHANRLWHEIYGRLSAGRPGMLGAMTARGEAQVMRLACLYAVADISSFVELPHLRAALEVWRYCFDSARCLFGDRLGHPTGDEILVALRRAWPESLSRTEISDLFKRNRPASEIAQALELLASHRPVACDLDRTKDGRPTAVGHTEQLNELNEVSPGTVGIVRLFRLFRRPCGR